MRRIYPQIPDAWNCVVVGYFVESNDSDNLSEDMVDVELPNGIVVSGGWIPDRDEQGQYVITATLGLSHVVPPFPAKSATAAADDLCRLVNVLQGREDLGAI
jgi:hypothetical protein